MKKKRIKTILIHLAIWVLWLLFNLYELEVPITALDTSGWLQLIYNYTSLVIVFYTISWIMINFYRFFSYFKYASLKGQERVKYAVNSKVFLLPLVIVLYVSVSIFLDNNLFGYKYPTIMSHILQRLTRILLYVISAVVYSYLYYSLNKLKKMIIARNRRVRQLQADNRELRKLIKQLSDESLLN
jgi:hypothetical protein